MRTAFGSKNEASLPIAGATARHRSRVERASGLTGLPRGMRASPRRASASDENLPRVARPDRRIPVIALEFPRAIGDVGFVGDYFERLS
jgi:hypothetical protein